MISAIRIQNFKSITDLTLKLGRVTVMIGENGSGKSNILESITFATSATAGKLDNSYLFSRGIRDTEAEWMRPAFEEDDEKPRTIKFTIQGETKDSLYEGEITPQRNSEDNSFVNWSTSYSPREGSVEALKKELRKGGEDKAVETVKNIIKIIGKNAKKGEKKALQSFLNEPITTVASFVDIFRQFDRNDKFATTDPCSDFIIYAPENATLRTPPPEGAVSPVGPKGEGLFRLLQTFNDPKFSDRLDDMKKRLHLFGWFEDFSPPDDAGVMQAKVQIRDKWLAKQTATFDQRIANEGFLYLLFYFSVIMSWRTPKFFAFDNIDNALNPRLCSELMSQVVDLSKRYEKQIICTTHNPAVLDGLDLNDNSQRLYAIKRDSRGRTIARRIRAPQTAPGEQAVRLSEAFTRGIIGGLPNHF